MEKSKDGLYLSPSIQNLKKLAVKHLCVMIGLVLLEITLIKKKPLLCSMADHKGMG